MKRIIKLTENDLHRIVKNAVKTAINEGFFDRFKTPKAPQLGNEPTNNVPSTPGQTDYDKSLRDAARKRFGQGFDLLYNASMYLEYPQQYPIPYGYTISEISTPNIDANLFKLIYQGRRSYSGYGNIIQVSNGFAGPTKYYEIKKQ